MDVVVPDLRGFGESDKHAVEPGDGYSAAAQARSVVGLMDELGARPRGPRGLRRRQPRRADGRPGRAQRVRALVLAPPLPGAGDRVLTAAAQREFWYQAFHQLELAEQLVDGKPDAVRAYLRTSGRTGPGRLQLADRDLDRLSSATGSPGRSSRRSAGTARARAWSRRASRSAHRRPRIGSRSPRGSLARPRPAVPARVVGPARRVLLRVTVTPLPDAGHFTPLEAPQALAAAIRQTVAGI